MALTKTKIEFKLWDPIAKQFISGYEAANKLLLKTANNPDNPLELSVSYATGPDEYLYFCRYTGIKDNKRKRIYVGDIIQFRSDDKRLITSEVKLRDGQFIVKSDYGVYEGLWGQASIKIIGNKFQNPKLIDKFDDPELLE